MLENKKAERMAQWLLICMFTTYTVVTVAQNSNWLFRSKEVCEQFNILNSSSSTTVNKKTSSINDVLRLKNTIYLIYDINPPEGFNLRRDVYIRLAVFVHKLQQRHAEFANIRLVLPPWRRLYHWRSQHIAQENIPWSTFFDIESMRRYTPVLDFPEFVDEISELGYASPLYKHVQVDKVFQLQQFKEMFDANGEFRDKYEFATDCERKNYLQGNHILQQPLLQDKEFHCVRYQGSVNLLERILRQSLRKMNPNDLKIFAVLNAEIVLHDQWGDKEYWRARRSMRFASPLISIADEFRARKFSSTNDKDLVQRPPMWELERPYRKAIGGSYLCAHLRRGDFVHSRENTTPTLHSAAAQIKLLLRMLRLDKVFIATDADAFELTNLRSNLPYVQLVRYKPDSLQIKHEIKDGGVAIIDQIICSHAHYFIGTYESTFTYRIYEEREILGFQKNSTFNTFCKGVATLDCIKNSVWPIVY